ncbi:DNA internalization-related competence protein ComEC/Rec2 [Aeribacillus pallidus]|nr:DNA internalization-related competence protein ComEC/Rec2 [Aeribacillus pallidus]
MRGQWAYVAISALLAIVSATSFPSFLPFFIFAALLFFLWLQHKRKLAFIVACSFLFMLPYFHWYDQQNKTNYHEGMLSAKGKVISSPEIDGDLMTFAVETNQGEKLTARYTLKTKQEMKSTNNIRPGDICNFSGKLEKPKNNTNENAFNYKRYLYFQQIHWLYKLDKIGHCTYKPSWKDHLENYRQKMIEWIHHKFPEKTAGFVLALTVGYQNNIPEEDLAAYRKLGIVHILSISGLHVSILIASLYIFLLRLGISKEQTIMILICFLPFYALLTGGAPPVVRASLMAALIMGGTLFKQNMPLSDSISFSFLLMTFLDPYEVFHLGFQLSYAVTFSLILSRQIFQKCRNSLQLLAAVSFVAQTVSLPIICYYFYQFSLLSFIMNIMFVPLYTFFLLPLTMITLILTVISSSIGSIFVSLLHTSFTLSSKTALFFGDLPFFTITTGKPSVFLFLLQYIIFISLFFQMEHKPMAKWGKPILCSGLLTALLLIAGKMTMPGEVTVLDVGQGDSIFIREPGLGNSYLIDTGGMAVFEKESWQMRKKPFSIALDVLIPYFQSKGVEEIEILFLTHGDYDHIGESLTLIKQFRVNKLVIPKYFSREELEKQIVKEAKNRGIEIFELEAGDRITGRTAFHVLSPFTKSDSKNNDSLVLMAKIGGLRWLFTGDLEESGERHMIKQYPKMTADVVKIGHHGSRTSTSDIFLQTIDPKIGVISAGRNNRFGHPHQEVLNRLKKQNVSIFRTDQLGAVQYKYRKSQGTFLFYPPYDTLTK